MNNPEPTLPVKLKPKVGTVHTKSQTKKSSKPGFLPKNQTPRKTVIRYTEEEIGKMGISKILSWYQHDVPLESIRQKLTSSKIAAVALCDVYGVLYTQYQNSKLAQRRSNLQHELTLDRFYWVWQQWKSGVEEDEILKKTKSLTHCSFGGVNALLASFRRRWKATKEVEVASHEESSRHIFRKGKWINYHGQVYLGIPAELFLQAENKLLVDVSALQGILQKVPQIAVKPDGFPVTVVEPPAAYDPASFAPGVEPTHYATEEHVARPRMDPALGHTKFGDVKFGQESTQEAGNPVNKQTVRDQNPIFDPKTWMEAQEGYLQELDEAGVPELPEVMDQKRQEDMDVKSITPEKLQEEIDELLG